MACQVLGEILFGVLSAVVIEWREKLDLGGLFGREFWWDSALRHELSQAPLILY